MRIRRIDEAESDAVAEVWHAAGRAAYGFLASWSGYTLERARSAFRQSILPQCDVWVAEVDGAVVGYLAIKGSYLDRLYVHPSRQGEGIGTALLEHARRLSPCGLQLHTHQKNVRACAFYERHGFVAVAHGISPPPESEPDVELHWRPGGVEEAPK